MSKLFCTSIHTSVKVSDPAPPRPPGFASGTPEPSTRHPPPGPYRGRSTRYRRPPASTRVPREVLQEVTMHFKIFVCQNTSRRHQQQFVLGFALEDCFASQTAYLSVTQSESSSKHGGKRLWEVHFDPASCQTGVKATDGGPSFCWPVLRELECFTALQVDDSSGVDPDTIEPVPVGEGCRFTLWKFEVNSNFSENVVLCFELGISRRILKSEWTRLSCKKAPQVKSTLLELAERTGDIILVGTEGVEAFAHSAVLVDVPYFEAKLREEWSGTTAWNLHNKLRLQLPCPIGAETLKLFLQGLYGDLRSLNEVRPESLLLQEVLSLAEACGVLGLCADVIQLVEVTSANVDSWLEWLLEEHGVDAESIRDQVVQVMRCRLQDALEWDPLSVEQLASISRLLPRRPSLHR